VESLGSELCPFASCRAEREGATKRWELIQQPLGCNVLDGVFSLALHRNDNFCSVKKVFEFGNDTIAAITIRPPLNSFDRAASKKQKQ